MAIQIRRAQRKRAKLRCGIFGPSGSGKTMSALKLAFGLGKRVGLIDTEHGSGEMYADLGEYDVIQLEAPYTVGKYREAIQAFEAEEYDVIIIDSLSHAWAGEGGLLDKQGGLVSSGKYKSGFDAWREVTPDYNRLVEELLNSPAHIIGTMRTKVEYVIEKDDRGKNVPRKIGLSPIQRDSLEYEFSVCFEVADNHYARASKDRTNLFDGWSDIISEETGHKLNQWLESGIDAPPPKTADDEHLERIEKALAEAPDAERVARITKHHELAHLRDRLRNGKRTRLDTAIKAAEARTAPQPEPEPEPSPPTDEQPAVENYDWPDANSKEAA